MTMTQEQFNTELLKMSEMYWDGLLTKEDLLVQIAGLINFLE